MTTGAAVVISDINAALSPGVPDKISARWSARPPHVWVWAEGLRCSLFRLNPRRGGGGASSARIFERSLSCRSILLLRDCRGADFRSNALNSFM